MGHDPAFVARGRGQCNHGKSGGLASAFAVRHTKAMPPAPDPPSSDPFVFHDPSGRRGRRAGQFGGLMLSLLAAIVAGFLITLALAPRLPDVQLRDPRAYQALHVKTSGG